MTITAGKPELSTLARQYAEDGFVLVKGLLSKEEAASYRQRSHDLLARLNRSDDPTWGSAMGLSSGWARRTCSCTTPSCSWSRRRTGRRFRCTKIIRSSRTPTIELVRRSSTSTTPRWRRAASGSFRAATTAARASTTRKAPSTSSSRRSTSLSGLTHLVSMLSGD